MRRSSAIVHTIERIASHARVVAARHIACELAPVWWVARGYVAVVGIAVLVGSGWSTRYPAVPRLGNAPWGVAAILIAAVASIALGLRTRNARGNLRRAVIAANVLCVALVFPAAGRVGDSPLQPPTVVAVPAPFAQPGLAYNGEPVHNIYPYTLDGKLLHDVLLYDGAGNPLDIGVGVPDPNRRILTTTANASVFNSFPIRYYEPDTVRVAHPNAGPPIKTPTVLPEPR